ncbi:MAG TPA: hypothetical protein VM266_07810 [Solirubrobacteraceae bacterium]|nr:hypothetical protein [Solirubrobacteraceae bacterium]
MGYKLLGMAVWKGGKLVLRRKYGRTYVPKPLIAGGLLVAAIGLLLVARAREES